MNETAVLDYIRRQVQRAGSQRKLAAELKISAAYLSDVLLGRRQVSDQMLERFGLIRLKHTTIITKRDTLKEQR